MRDWKAMVRSQPGAEALPLDVIEEIAQHADELYKVHRANGNSDADSTRAVVVELSQMDAILQAARRLRQRPALASAIHEGGSSESSGTASRSVRPRARHPSCARSPESRPCIPL